MSEPTRTAAWERRLRAVGQAFEYPQTPDVVPAVQLARRSQRRTVAHLKRPALIAGVLLLVLGTLWSVPAVRAGVRAILRIGAVEIVLPAPTPIHIFPVVTPTLAKPVGATAQPMPPTMVPRFLTPALAATTQPEPTTTGSLLDLPGQTTLAEARRHVPFPLRLPGFPADLGLPDRVFVQDLAGPAVILVWLEPGQPTRIRLSLHLLSSDLLMRKSMVTQLTQTTVSGHAAAWVTGPHLIEVRTADGGRTIDQRRLVDGNTLIWTNDSLTYRLETRQTLLDAVHTAESLH